jgi:membrane protein
MAQMRGLNDRAWIVQTKAIVARIRGWVERTLVWRIWERMLEIEFVDRSVALAGKAFVSFFPLVIVVAAFMPAGVRTSIFSTLTHRLGVHGAALRSAKAAFATSDNVRRATGFLGIILTVFYATSFTTALQRIYLRAWRRPPAGAAGTYTRGPAWLVAMVAFMAATGALRSLFSGAFTVLFVILSLATTTALWWFTAWFMLKGAVRWRVLMATGIVTAIANGVYTIYANVWMSHVLERNQAQFGVFGIALALVSWFSGAAICLVIGACAGPVLAEDDGPIGRLIRGGRDNLLVAGADPPMAAPEAAVRLRDAFRPVDEEVGQE